MIVKLNRFGAIKTLVTPSTDAGHEKGAKFIADGSLVKGKRDITLGAKMPKNTSNISGTLFAICNKADIA